MGLAIIDAYQSIIDAYQSVIDAEASSARQPYAAGRSLSTPGDMPSSTLSMVISLSCMLAFLGLHLQRTPSPSAVRRSMQSTSVTEAISPSSNCPAAVKPAGGGGGGGDGVEGSYWGQADLRGASAPRSHCSYCCR